MAPALKSRYIVVLSLTRQYGPHKWERSKIDAWVSKVGGVLEKSVSNRTTHVVCDQDVFDAQGDEICRAQDAIAGGQKLFIVQFKWLFETLHEGKKMKEQNYTYEGRNFPPIRQSTTNNDAGETVETFDKITDVLLGGIKDYVDSRELDKLKKSFVEKNAAEQEKAQEAARIEAAKVARERKEHAVRLRKDLWKPLNDRFEGTHHVYRTPETGFVFQIHLIKVDVAANRNKRIILTIYESNDEPKTYAMNMHSAATATHHENTVFPAIDSNFLTSYRLFRKVFEEKTYVKWEDRFEAFEQGSAHLALVQKTRFENRPFTYQIPAYGPTDPFRPVEAALEEQNKPTDEDETPRVPVEELRPALEGQNSGSDEYEISMTSVEEIGHAVEEQDVEGAHDDAQHNETMVERPSEASQLAPLQNLGQSILGEHILSTTPNTPSQDVDMIVLD